MIFKLILKNFLLLSGGIFTLIFTLVILRAIVMGIIDSFVDFMVGITLGEFRIQKLFLCLGLSSLLIFAVAFFYS